MASGRSSKSRSPRKSEHHVCAGAGPIREATRSRSLLTCQDTKDDTLNVGHFGDSLVPSLPRKSSLINPVADCSDRQIWFSYAMGVAAQTDVSPTLGGL